MSGHTPGPWKFVADEFNSHGGRNQLGSIQSRKWFIAVIEGDAGEDTNECMANARLIAAAPDLFESLIMAVKYLKGENMGSVMLPKFEAAIAKAEGKS